MEKKTIFKNLRHAYNSGCLIVVTLHKNGIAPFEGYIDVSDGLDLDSGKFTLSDKDSRCKSTCFLSRIKSVEIK